MTWLLAALTLPSLFWDKGPDTAQMLQKAKISHIYVPAERAQEWKSVNGISAEAMDVQKAERISAPDVKFRVNQASATRAPWVESNAWRFLRRPEALYLVDGKGPAAALAAAEAYTYHVRAAIQTDEAGLQPLCEMLTFLDGLKGQELKPMANIGYLDDGSPASGEFMNLLVRRNLLFRVVQNTDADGLLPVKLGTPDYPREEAANPSLLAEKARWHVSDEKRLLRIYGSDLVIGRLMGNADSAQLYLLNYGGAKIAVNGLRVRVRGHYDKFDVHDYASASERAVDPSHDEDGSEFTIKSLKTFAVINLSR